MSRVVSPTRTSTCASTTRATRLAELEAEASAPDLWDDPDRARKVTSRAVGGARRRRAGRRARRARRRRRRRCTSSAARRTTTRSKPRSTTSSTALRSDARQARAARAVHRRARRARRDLRGALRRGRHRRAGLGRDAAAHVPRWAERRASTVEVDEIQEGQEAGITLGDVHREGSLRVRDARRRARRAPADPHLAVRRATRAARPRSRRSTACPRSKQAEAARDRPERPAHRHVPLVGRGRPARERHRLGGAHHAPPDRRRRVVPERALAAPEQGEGDADPRGAARRACSARSSARSSSGSRARSRTSRSAARSAPTCSRRTSW